jgi:hypothetical protein
MARIGGAWEVVISARLGDIAPGTVSEFDTEYDHA